VQENVGNRDRMMRSIVGPMLMGVGLTKMGARQGRPLGLATMIAGALIMESAVTRVCPVNAALGIDTRERKV